MCGCSSPQRPRRLDLLERGPLGLVLLQRLGQHLGDGLVGGIDEASARHGVEFYTQTKVAIERWPKIAFDYVLIGIEGEWPAQKDPDAP